MPNSNENATDELEGKKKKKEKKEKKKPETELSNIENEEEKLSSKLLLFVVTLLIILIWLGIIALLIKMDVGGFGSSVLSPLLKDVPYINKILPESEDEIMETENSENPYKNTKEAVDRIKELELALANAQDTIKKNDAEIASLNEQITDLSKYKEEQSKFETEKEKFYEEVVFGDEAPDIEEYKTFYESIEPENAEVLYKQVVEQTNENEQLKSYVQTYSSMKAKNAAAIFDTMTDDYQLVASILEAMDAKSRADILAQMNTENAARLTQILEP